MPSLEPVLHPPACPDRETLEAFHLGKLTEPALETLAEHVAACPACSAAVEALQREMRGHLLGQLQQCRLPEALVEEPGCARLEAAALALRLAPTGEATLGASDAASVTPGPRTVLPEDGEAGAPPLPAAVGPYEVLAKLGQGGMGVVYKARQCPVNRLVALKMVLTGAHASSQALARFRTEGQAVARLRHPHVVQIYEFGTHEGLPYYSMELLEGGTLARRLAENPLAPREAAALVQRLAGAVEYAHQAQVLHRDLKPANILLTSDGEPKIADFGLAKLLDEEHGQTHSDLVLGTPSYMAPEQAAARAQDIGPATDVYALGAILYQALTGRPPFKADSKAETLRLVLHAAPLLPSRLRREVPAVLEAICLKCLQKPPARRYASAQQLADDLERWRHGEPTEARPPGPLARAGRWARRYAVALGFLAVLGAALSILYWHDPQRDLERIEATLAAGQRVTLLGALGFPRWHRVRAGEKKTQLSLAEDGTFSVSTWSPCLLELVTDPRCDSYRLSAEVRHDQSDVHGDVGLFVAQKALAGAPAEVHLFTALSYNDQRGVADLISLIDPAIQERMKEKFKKQPKLPEGNPVHFGPASQAPGKSGTSGLMLWDRTSALRFPPAGSGFRSPWRTLELTVTPHEVRARWEGQAAGTLPVARLEKGLGKAVAWYRKVFPNHEALAADASAFPGRGSLGIFLLQGSASFRNVAVTPLRGGD